MSPEARVAVSHVSSYDPESLQLALDSLAARLGGLQDIVRPDSTVVIKVNLTGRTHRENVLNIVPINTYVTHPQIVKALVRQVKKAGAGNVFIVEAVTQRESFRELGYERIASETGAILLDLNEPYPYMDFTEVPVKPAGFVYQSFVVNRIIETADVLISVSKMKSHYLAGVTHTMKNLFGLVPYRFYRLKEEHWYRSAFHGTSEQVRSRLPRVIVDLARARRIDYGVVDGIFTVEGGEGPWVSRINPIQPGVLIAGKNCVAVDAVAASLMNVDPMGTYPSPPFLHCDNHLNIAREAGLGTNHPHEIDVLLAD